MKKAKKRANLGELEALLVPNHSQLEALNKANFTDEVIKDRSGPLSGSHVID